MRISALRGYRQEQSDRPLVAAPDRWGLRDQHSPFLYPLHGPWTSDSIVSIVIGIEMKDEGEASPPLYTRIDNTQYDRLKLIYFHVFCM